LEFPKFSGFGLEETFAGESGNDFEKVLIQEIKAINEETANYLLITSRKKIGVFLIF
jgi:hypothetical protein